MSNVRRHMVNVPALQGSLLAYARVVDQLYGHYLDSTTGFVANERTVTASQQRPVRGLAPGVNRDNLSFHYGNGNPNDPKSRVLHRTTQGAYKARNAKGGSNHVRAGQLLLVLLYEYWESEHRSKVAAALCIERDAIKVPFIGDLRLLRQDVIHHQGVVRPETVKKLEVLGGLVEGSAISLSGQQVEDIVVGLKSALDKLALTHGAPDTNYRGAWLVQ